MKDNNLIYYSIESLFKIIDFLITSIFLKSCDKMWLTLNCLHYIIIIDCNILSNDYISMKFIPFKSSH
jgi:hypothetical protein